MHRAGQRIDVAIDVTLLRGGKQVRARLINLSATGVNAVAAFAPGPKEAVQILWNGKALPCHVVWARANSFGLAFDRPLAPSILASFVDSAGKPD
ncbi:MAG: PilZ domain-containing protein [Sphingobium phenoxybenzoativorans]|uniref:PilZ domain-containing protein n=1 Tax=Sphingobium phenoxybenzoativorans TaxID=1592790 RepID=A0A975Q145_9SPHN|nr:PilZ domain-containing protein [Sphingobium phenoxybenzoativorans]QUT05038.1 PilZ domain-containing protein [Sphingobium phenoxybenzoativorans]